MLMKATNSLNSPKCLLLLWKPQLLSTSYHDIKGMDNTDCRMRMHSATFCDSLLLLSSLKFHVLFFPPQLLT